MGAGVGHRERDRTGKTCRKREGPRRRGSGCTVEQSRTVPPDDHRVGKGRGSGGWEEARSYRNGRHPSGVGTPSALRPEDKTDKWDRVPVHLVHRDDPTVDAFRGRHPCPPPVPRKETRLSSGRTDRVLGDEDLRRVPERVPTGPRRDPATQ